MTSSYEIICRRAVQLPRLAWCATVAPEIGSVRVDHGDWVECHDEFFVEGAWDGAFSDPSFADALLFMGSGARAVSDGIVFSTASHPLEPMFYVRSGKDWLFSNSLAFILSRANLALDEEFPHYLSVLASPRLGLKRYTEEIPTTGESPVSMFLYGSLKVDREGSITRLCRPEPRNFKNYHDYKSFLTDHLSELWANARSPERRQKFGLVTTVSSGYDSAACAALAKEIGGQEAVTFRATADGRDDSGTAIAQHLGMQIHEFAREDCFANTQSILEFASSVDGDFHFAACEAVLSGKLCLTGFFGDSLWAKSYKPPLWGNTNTSLTRTEFSGGGLNEFRLRSGFVHVPVAMIGMSQDCSLWQITNSAEMAPWTLNTSYDRPIPRRIAEEAGVPRELFGQVKKVTVTAYNPDNSALQQLDLSREYQNRPAGRRSISTLARIRHNALAAALRMARRGARFCDKRRILPARFRLATYGAPLTPIRYMYSINQNSFLIPWATNRLRGRYAAALAEADKLPTSGTPQT